MTEEIDDREVIGELFAESNNYALEKIASLSAGRYFSATAKDLPEVLNEVMSLF